MITAKIGSPPIYNMLGIRKIIKPFKGRCANQFYRNSAFKYIFICKNCNNRFTCSLSNLIAKINKYNYFCSNCKYNENK